MVPFTFGLDRKLTSACVKPTYARQQSSQFHKQKNYLSKSNKN